MKPAVQCGQLVGHDMVLAGDTVHLAQARLDPGQALRVQLRSVGEAVQLAHGFLDLDACLAEHADHLGQRTAITPRQRVEALQRLAEQRQHAAVIAVAAFRRMLRLAQRLLGVGELLLLVLQGSKLVLAQGKEVQLLDLIAQQLAACLDFVTVLGQLLEPFAGCLPAAKVSVSSATALR